MSTIQAASEAVPTKRAKRTCVTAKDFLNEYDLPVQPVQDFEWDGVPAQYPHGHPKEWGSETEVIDFTEDCKSTPEFVYTSYHTALSSDKKLLAISSSSHERILIYNVNSRKLCQVLAGAERVAFRPVAGGTGETEGASDDTVEPNVQPAYTLISSVAKERSRFGSQPPDQLIFWELDQNGRLLDEEEPIDPSLFATQALEAILPDLIAKHEWTKEFVDASSIHADFTKSLQRAAATHSRRHNTILDHALLGGFGSVSFSTDGKLLLYHQRNGTTQNGTREPQNLPHLVLYDLDAGHDLHRLSGHTDAIMWSGISPDSQHVASVSWDGTMRMYAVSTGELLWATGDSGGQCWSGAFSPDSQHIVWSQASGTVVSVHAVATGKEVSRFGEKFSRWCRCLAWHPDGSQIALCVDKHAYVWLPFKGDNGTVTQHFVLNTGEDNEWRSMASVENVSWTCNGRFLCVCISEGSVFVYDVESNTKQLFKRPAGRDKAWVYNGFHGLIEKEGEDAFFLSVDGDSKVRYWHTPLRLRPSWWEKQDGEATDVSLKKTPFPETGKYVKVTKPLVTGE